MPSTYSIIFIHLDSNSKCNTTSPDGLRCAMRTKSFRHLSAEERETVSLGLAHGHSLRTMALVLGRAPSTMSREVARNVTRGRPYRACRAHTLATGRACQPRRPRKLVHPWLWQYVRTQLAQGCSPEQIADGSDARILTIWGNTARPRPSMQACMSCPVASCGVSSWRRCVRRAKRAGLERGAPIVGASSPI